jgi:hypothetical protein
VARARQLLSLRTLVVLQLAAIAVLSVATAARFHVWAEVDERAHYANIQSLAEEGRYPRPEDLVSPEVQAITDDTFPRPSPNDPRNQGLAGRAYEAVQTPVYYLLATPAFLLPVDHRQKVFVLRAFDVALLAVALALAAVLAREVLRERWLAGYAAVLAVVLWPGVLVRMVTVSNDVLAVPVGLLFALLAWQAWTRRSAGRLVAAGGAFGLVVLTKVTLLFLAPVLVLLAADAFLRWQAPRARAAAGAALLLPLVLVAPWAAVNEARYGRLGLTEGSAAVAALYATDPRLAGQELLARLARLLDSALPQEFAAQYEDGGLGAVVTRAMTLALVVFGAAGALVARRATGAIAAIVLGLPLVAGILGLVVGDLLGADDHFFGRYLYVGALLFALFGALAWTVACHRRVVVGWAVGVSLVAAGFWVHLAAAYYFVDLGRRLGLA